MLYVIKMQRHKCVQEGRRIESRSICLTKQKQNDPKKFTRNSSPTNFEYKPREVIAEYNIVRKTIREKIT